MNEVTDPAECRRVVEERIRESDLREKKYFHRVAAGSQRSYGHQAPSERFEAPPERENYGVHAAADDTLVLIDIDDHKDGFDVDALEFARENLPETLTFSSAHDGEGRLYHVPADGDGHLPAARLKREFGKENITAVSWGEIRVSNQYIVAAGSQLDADGCTKDDCTECEKPDGGRYTVLHDRPVATLNADLLVRILAEDSELDKVSDENEGEAAFDALGALDAERVAEETIVARWNDDHGSGENVRAFYPTWNPNCNGTANVVGPDGWRDTGGRGAGGPVVMAAIACDDLPEFGERTTAGDVSGEDWVTAYNYLRELGFDLPELDGGRQKPENTRSWEYVRYLFAEETAARGRAAAQKVLRERYEFLTVDSDDELYVYDEETGVFTQELGEVRAEIYDGLTAEHWSRHNSNEILAGLKQKNRVERREFNGRKTFTDPHICVENGVLNLFTRELIDHSPEYKFVDRVPVEYDPNADSTRFEEFMSNITDREADAKAMLEMVGHALTPDAYERGWKKFLVLHGGSDNGKSFFYSLVQQLMGEENVSNVKLADISSGRFSKDDVYGHMANIAGEINGKKIRNTADLKDITGGDRMRIEPKGDSSIFDTINATLMFAANDPPKIGNRDKKAIATRIVPVELPFQFVENPEGPMEKQKVPEKVLKDELATDEAMSALLNLALDGVERLEENYGDVSLPESPMERLEMYERDADPMAEFASKCLESDTRDYLVKDDVTEIYKAWAQSNGHEIGGNLHQTLHSVIEYPKGKKRSPDYTDTDLPLLPWEDRKPILDRVTLTDEGVQFAREAGLVVDDNREETPENGAQLDGLTAGFDDVTVKVAEKLEPPEWLVGKGHIVDEDGNILPYKCEGSNPLADVDEGDRVRLRNVNFEETKKGMTAVLSGVTGVENLSSPAEQSSIDDKQAAADGGETVEDPPEWASRLWGIVRSNGGEAEEGAILADLTNEYDVSRAQMIVDQAKDAGSIENTPDGYTATAKLERMV